MHPAERIGQFAHDFLVGPTHDDRTDTVVEDLLDRDDVTVTLWSPRTHDVETFVEHDFGTQLEYVEVDVGVHVDLHLAAVGQHVDRLVVVASDDHAVGRRRLRQFVDFVTQVGDVFAGLAQREAQLLVLGRFLGQQALGLEQSFLELPHAQGGVGQSATQGVDLLVEGRDGGPQGLDIGHLVTCHDSEPTRRHSDRPAVKRVSRVGFRHGPA